MIKRSAVMGIGVAFPVIGLADLALLQTAVVYRPASKEQFGLLDVKPPGPSPEGPGRQAGLELRQVPGPPDGIKQTPEPGNQTEQVRAPRSGAINSSLAGSKAWPHPSREALQPVVIRFHVDPAQKREINVAQVHLGDSISVRVRRFGQALEHQAQGSCVIRSKEREAGMVFFPPTLCAMPPAPPSVMEVEIDVFRGLQVENYGNRGGGFSAAVGGRRHRWS